MSEYKQQGSGDGFIETMALVMAPRLSRAVQAVLVFLSGMMPLLVYHALLYITPYPAVPGMELLFPGVWVTMLLAAVVAGLLIDREHHIWARVLIALPVGLLSAWMYSVEVFSPMQQLLGETFAVVHLLSMVTGPLVASLLARPDLIDNPPGFLGPPGPGDRC